LSLDHRSIADISVPAFGYPFHFHYAVHISRLLARVQLALLAMVLILDMNIAARPT
jgi:hypothetical protein